MTDELWREEEKKTLERIAKLTELGKVKWECVEYNPLCFMNEDKVDETSAYLCQMFTLTAEIDYSGPLAHPGRSLAQLDRASAHSTRSAVQPMLAADQHTC